MVIILLVAGTLLAHALWVLAELESRLTQADIARVSAMQAARAESLRRADSIVSAVDPPDPDADVLQRAIGHSGPGGSVDWVTLAVRPTPRSILTELGAGVVVGEDPDPGTLSRTSAEGSACSPPGGVLWRNWSVEAWQPTLAGRSIPQWLALLPELAGPWHTVAPDTLAVGLIGSRAGPVYLSGTGSVLVAAPRVVLRTGSTLTGVVLSTAGVELEPGAHFSGLIAGLAGLRLPPGASLTVSSCAAADVLRASPLVAPRRIGPPAWPAR